MTRLCLNETFTFLNYHRSMSRLPPKMSGDHPIADGQPNDEPVAPEEDHASGEAPFQVSLLHLDSPGAGARMRRAMRLILKRRGAPEE